MEVENEENCGWNGNCQGNNGQGMGQGVKTEFPVSQGIHPMFMNNGGNSAPQNNFFPTNTQPLFSFGGQQGGMGQFGSQIQNFQPNLPQGQPLGQENEDFDEEFKPEEDFDETDHELPGDLVAEKDCLINNDEQFDLQHYLSVRNQL